MARFLFFEISFSCPGLTKGFAVMDLIFYCPGLTKGFAVMDLISLVIFFFLSSKKSKQKLTIFSKV